MLLVLTWVMFYMLLLLLLVVLLLLCYYDRGCDTTIRVQKPWSHRLSGSWGPDCCRIGNFVTSRSAWFLAFILCPVWIKINGCWGFAHIPAPHFSNDFNTGYEIIYCLAQWTQLAWSTLVLRWHPRMIEGENRWVRTMDFIAISDHLSVLAKGIYCSRHILSCWQLVNDTWYQNHCGPIQ